MTHLRVLGLYGHAHVGCEFRVLLHKQSIELLFLFFFVHICGLFDHRSLFVGVEGHSLWSVGCSGVGSSWLSVEVALVSTQEVLVGLVSSHVGGCFPFQLLLDLDSFVLDVDQPVEVEGALLSRFVLASDLGVLQQVCSPHVEWNALLELKLVHGVHDHAGRWLLHQFVNSLIYDLHQGVTLVFASHFLLVGFLDQSCPLLHGLFRNLESSVVPLLDAYFELAWTSDQGAVNGVNDWAVLVLKAVDPAE